MAPEGEDRKSTRLNSSHEWTSYAVFCLKKKNSGSTSWSCPNRTFSTGSSAALPSDNSPKIHHFRRQRADAESDGAHRVHPSAGAAHRRRRPSDLGDLGRTCRLGGR